MTLHDVKASILRDFPESRWEHVASLLSTYGAREHERERERVQAAILKLACGDEKTLEELVRVDYRDVLLWADQPDKAKITLEERQEAIAALRKLDSRRA